MKTLTIIIVTILLVGCDKFNDMVSTSLEGHVVKCIDGTQYILMTSERGLAITPHLGTDGKPKGC